MAYLEQIKELEDFLKFNIPRGATRHDIAVALVREGWLKNMSLKPDDLIKDGVCLICHCDKSKHADLKENITAERFAEIACDAHWHPGSYQGFVLSSDFNSLKFWNKIGEAIKKEAYA